MLFLILWLVSSLLFGALWAFLGLELARSDWRARWAFHVRERRGRKRGVA